MGYAHVKLRLPPRNLSLTGLRPWFTINFVIVFFCWSHIIQDSIAAEEIIADEQVGFRSGMNHHRTNLQNQTS